MCRQGPAIDLCTAARRSDPLADLEYDTSKAVLVDVDFLVIGNLAKLAADLISKSLSSLLPRLRHLHRKLKASIRGRRRSYLPNIDKVVGQVHGYGATKQSGIFVSGHDGNVVGFVAVILLFPAKYAKSGS